jgi:hypothetical protein
MSELKQLLEESPVAVPCGAESLISLLYDAYFETQGPSSQAIKDGYKSLYDYIKNLPTNDKENVIDIVSTLCMEHERAAFMAGVKTRIRLLKELFM